MSPLTLTCRMTDEQIGELFEATKATLIDWTDRLREDAGRRVSGESHRVPRRNGRARPIQAPVSRSAAHRFSAFDTRTTKRTIARAARRADGCSPIVLCRGCSSRIGRDRSMKLMSCGVSPRRSRLVIYRRDPFASLRMTTQFCHPEASDEGSSPLPLEPDPSLHSRIDEPKVCHPDAPAEGSRLFILRRNRLARMTYLRRVGDDRLTAAVIRPAARPSQPGRVRAAIVLIGS